MSARLPISFLISILLLICTPCAKANSDIETASKAIQSLIEAGDFGSANTAIQKMKTDFSGEPELAEQLCRVAYAYEKVESLEPATALNAQIAADFLPSNDTVYARLQLKKLQIYDQIDSSDYASAATAVNKMKADFSGNVNLARRLWEVANRYDKRDAYGYAKALSTQIASTYPSDAYGKYAALLVERLNVYELIDSGQYVSANQAVSEIKQSFAGHKQLPRRLYEIAGKYEKVEAFDHSKTLCLHIAADYPNDKYGSNAALLAAKLGINELIDSGNMESADSRVSALRENFASHEHLPRRLYEIAAKYDAVEDFERCKTLCVRNSSDYPNEKYGTSAALLATRLDIYDLIDSGDMNAVDTAVSKMCIDFAGHEHLCKRIWDIANRYDKFKAYAQTKRICQNIVADYPNDEYTDYARLELAKLEVYELINRGKYESVDSAASEMMANFAGHKQLSRRLYEIAQALPDAGAWGEGKALHSRIAAAHPNDLYGSRSVIQAAKLNIYGFINSGDLEGAANAVSQLKTAYADHELLYSTLESIAEKYAIAGQHETARALYQQIVQECPANQKAAVVSKAGVVRCDINSAVKSEDEATADAITSKILSELTGSQYQQEAVHFLAYGLYTDLLAEESRTEDSALIANYALRVISLLENHLLPLELPLNVRADACLMSAECYYRLGVPTTAREYYQKHYDTSPGYRLECYSKHMIARCLEKELKLKLIPEGEAKSQIREIHQGILSDYPDSDAAEYAHGWLEKNP